MKGAGRMFRDGRNIYKYSTPFKKRVVKSIETGEYNVAEALRVFGCSKTSVYRWLRKYSKNYKIGKVVKVQNKDERDRLKELEEEVKHLREERDRAKLKNLALETLIKIADKEFKTDIKKNFGSRASRKQSQKLNDLITDKDQ